MLISGSVKIYKSRITQWGFDKKNKASDVEFVLRKKMHRDAVHKNTFFTVRGRLLDMKSFLKYVKRHHLLERTSIEANTADTPEHITYQTPAASPHSQSEVNELNDASNDADGGLEGVSDNDRLADYNLGHTTVSGYGCAQQNTQTALFVSEVQDLYRWLFDQPSLTRTLELPESMRLSERLFLLIPTYIAGAVRKGFWALDAGGFLISTTLTDKTHSGAAAQFNDNALLALEALDQGRFVEARQAFEKAFAHLPSMIRYDLPGTINVYLIVLRNMTTEGFPELADMLRRHMKDVAEKVLPPQNPASQIYAVMSEVDPDQLSNVLDKASECRNDSLARNLAPFSFDLIDSKITLIKRVHWNSPTEVDHCLYILLFECEQHCGYGSPCTLHVMYCTIDILVKQGRAAEAEAVSHDMHDRARHSVSFAYEVHAIELLARAQHTLGRLHDASVTLSSAIDMLEGVYGRNDPWRMRYIFRLEKWLREGGEEQEADALRIQLVEPMDDSGT
jgi:hypothetical protein